MEQHIVLYNLSMTGGKEGRLALIKRQLRVITCGGGNGNPLQYSFSFFFFEGSQDLFKHILGLVHTIAGLFLSW